MNTDKSQRNVYKQQRTTNLVVAFAFIAAGVLILLRNLGILNEAITSFFISWQMMLIVMGGVMVLKARRTKRNKSVGGIVLIAIGVFYLIPARFDMVSLWPLWFIVFGLAILYKTRRRSDTSFSSAAGEGQYTGGSSEEGFVNSDVRFGSAKHVVLEPFFKGGFLDVSFGEVVLDLRRTKLEQRETYIEIEAAFGGVKLLVPSSWNIVAEMDTTFSSFSDKRFVSHEIDSEHKLIIRGDVDFGGIEIKS